MIVSSKIRYFLFALLIVFQQVSCERNENDVIPDSNIDFTMDITGDVLFSSLLSISNSVIVTSQTNNWGEYSAGYKNSGIIIYRVQPDGFTPEFYAYDRTCPHDYAVNKLIVKVNIDFIQAICPECNTHYELSAGGIPSSGPGKYPLKNYKTLFDGRFLRVWNY